MLIIIYPIRYFKLIIFYTGVHNVINAFKIMTKVIN